MKPKDAYHFCPRCGKELLPEKGNFLTCTECGFHLFINASACAGAIIENEKGEVLLTIRAHEPGKGETDIPGGFIEPYEDAKTALKRELQEELGVEAEVGELIGTYPAEYPFQGINIPLINLIYVAKITSGEPQPSDDVAELIYVPKEKLLDHPIWDESLRASLKDYLGKS